MRWALVTEEGLLLNHIAGAAEEGPGSSVHKPREPSSSPEGQFSCFSSEDPGLISGYVNALPGSYTLSLQALVI